MASDKLQTCAPAVESNCHFDHHLSYSDVKQRTDGMSGKHCIKDASSVSEQNDLFSAWQMEPTSMRQHCNILMKCTEFILKTLHHAVQKGNKYWCAIVHFRCHIRRVWICSKCLPAAKSGHWWFNSSMFSEINSTVVYFRKSVINCISDFRHDFLHNMHFRNRSTQIQARHREVDNEKVRYKHGKFGRDCTRKLVTTAYKTATR